MGGVSKNGSRAFQREKKCAGNPGGIKRRTLVVLAAATAMPMVVSHLDAATKYWKNSVTSDYYYVSNDWSSVFCQWFGQRWRARDVSWLACWKPPMRLTHVITMYDYAGGAEHCQPGRWERHVPREQRIGGDMSLASEVIGTGVSGTQVGCIISRRQRMPFLIPERGRRLKPPACTTCPAGRLT